MASVKAHLWKGKTLKDGSHPIVLQIIHNRRKKVISLGYSCKPEQWNKDENKPNRKHPNSGWLNNYITSKLNTAQQLLLSYENRGETVDLDRIARKITNKASNDTFIKYGEAQVQSLIKSGKMGNARVYQNTINVFKEFRDSKDINFEDITPSLLRNYEEYLYARDNKPNTVSNHMRTIRAIYNRAMNDGIVSEEFYPFKKYKIRSVPTQKRAISREMIKKLEELDLSGDKEGVRQFARDMFLFSFYNRGMNYYDIAHLKSKDIQDNRITYKRKKTGQVFSIKLNEPSKKIINRYSDLTDPDAYIFPIIQRKQDEYLDYRNSLRLTNKKLNELGKDIGCGIQLSTYVARHSWATIAKYKGVSTSIISEALGHDSEETTQIYLDSFENRILDEADDIVIE